MSGIPKRHHFIPRFVQEGFASRKSRDAVFVWQYRRGALPFETNTVNVAVERYFHFSRRTAGIESRISDFENRFVRTMRTIRAGQLDQLPPGEVDQFFRHLALRLPTSRRFMETLAREVLSFMRSAIEELPREAVPARTFQQAMSAVLLDAKKNDPAASKRATHQFLEVLKSDLYAVLHNDMLDDLLETIDTIDVFAHVREEHSGALIEELSGIRSGPNVTKLRWSTRRSDNPDSLILGDIGPLAMSSNDASLEPLVGGKRDGRAALMAIDKSTWLVGESDFTLRDVAAAEWNDAVARYSDSMFIAAHYCEELAELAMRIGNMRPEFSLEKLSEHNPEFAAILSEEMRNPNNSIAGQLMTIPQRPKGRSIEKYFRT